MSTVVVGAELRERLGEDGVRAWMNILSDNEVWRLTW